MDSTIGTVRKADLIARIANATGIERLIVKDVIDRYTVEVIKALGRGERVDIRKFGNFVPVMRGAKTGNLGGKPTFIPARRVPKFFPSDLLLAVMSEPQPATTP